jgi:ribosomal protein S18 acetylase RimI-like enzyme
MAEAIQASNHGGVAVRPARPSDIAALGRLGAMLVAFHHESDPERFISPTAETERIYGEFLVSQLGKRDIVVLVAEEAGQVLGYTYSGLEGIDYKLLRGPAGVIYDLLVEPAARRKGAGGLLLDATLAELVKRGAPQVLLYAAERNQLAQNVFAAAGFRRTMVEMTWEPPG